MCQMLESKRVLLRFKVGTPPTTTSSDIYVVSPIKVKNGYISKYATNGGIVLDTDDVCCFSSWGREDRETLIDIGSLDISSMRLEGDGADDFEIVDNRKIQVVADSLDYEITYLY